MPSMGIVLSCPWKVSYMLSQPPPKPSEIRMVTVSIFRSRGAEELAQGRANFYDSFALIY